MKLPRVKRWDAIAFMAVLGATTLIVAEWFSHQNFVLFIDNYFPFNPAYQLVQLSGPWASYNGVGTLNVTNFPLLPVVLFVWLMHDVFQVPLWASQAALYGSLMSGGGVSMYLFVRSASFKENSTAQVAGIGAAFFYVLNPVFLDLYWYLNFPGAVGVFAGLPIVAYFIKRSVNRVGERKIDVTSLLGLAAGSVICGISELPYVASAGIIILALLVSFYLPRFLYPPIPNDRRFSARSLILSLGVMFAASAFWLIPELSISSYVASPHAYNYAQDLNILTGNSSQATIWNVATLLYFPLSNSFALWHNYYSLPTLLVSIAAVISLMIVYTPLLAVRSRRPLLSNTGMVLVLSLLLPVLMFVMLGNNSTSPFASVYLNVFSRSLTLQAFLRGPYLSFGNGIAFATSALFGIGVGVVRIAIRGVLDQLERLLRRFSRTSSYWGMAPRARLVGSVSQASTCAVVVLLLLTLSWPIVNGSAIKSLNSPATPIFPEEAFDAAKFVQDHQGAGTALVFPTTSGELADRWPGGDYLGPTYFGSLTGLPTIQDSSPALGSRSSYLLSLATTLPSLNSTVQYGKILQMAGVSVVVVDGYAEPNRYASFSNTTAIELSLARQVGITRAENFGDYAIYLVSNPNPPVYSASTVVNQSVTIVPSLNLVPSFVAAASNTTDASAKGYFTSSAAITNVTSNTFQISEFWPSVTERERSGTGFHYPGWPEVINNQSLDIDVGNFPFLNVTVQLTSGQANPVISLASVSTVRVLHNSPDTTLNQFFSAPIVSSSQNPRSGALSYLFELASPAISEKLANGTLGHIMIQLQPLGNSSEHINGTISMEAESYVPEQARFNPVTSVIVPDNFSKDYQSGLSEVRQAKISFHEYSPSRYRFSLNGGPGNLIVILLQSYDPNWTISVPGATGIVHFVADGFANGWLFFDDKHNLSGAIQFGFSSITTSSQVVTITLFSVLVTSSLVSRFPGLVRRTRRVISISRTLLSRVADKLREHGPPLAER